MKISDCIYCKQEFIKKRNAIKYCSISCANKDMNKIKAQNRSDSYRQKMSIAKKGKCLSNDHKQKISKSIKTHYIKNPVVSKLDNSKLENYRQLCRFKFNVYDYPDEFDIALLNEINFYKAKNRGDNLSGISRDHRVSVKYGFDNDIDPDIIGHPANCKLMPHNNNSSKGKKCEITLEYLLEKINEWNIKYSKNKIGLVA